MCFLVSFVLKESCEKTAPAPQRRHLDLKLGVCTVCAEPHIQLRPQLRPRLHPQRWAETTPKYYSRALTNCNLVGAGSRIDTNFKKQGLVIAILKH